MNKTTTKDIKEIPFYMNGNTSTYMNETISENRKEISFTEFLSTCGKLALIGILFCLFIWVCYKAHQGRKIADERRANRGGRIYALPVTVVTSPNNYQPSAPLYSNTVPSS